MNIKRWFIGSTLSATLLLLASCGQLGTTPTQAATPGETSGTLTSVGTGTTNLAKELQTEFEALLKDWGLSAATAQMGNWPLVAGAMVPNMSLLSSGKLQAADPKALGEAIRQAIATVSTLPRGVYSCSGSSCTKTAESDDYIVNQNTAKGLLKVELDWDASSAGAPSPTVQLHSFNYDGTPYQDYFTEAPTKMVAKVSLDSKVLAQGTLAVGWHASTCITGKYLADTPDSVQVNGFINRPSGNKAIEVNASYSIGANKVQTSGSLSVKGISNEGSANWNISSNGTVERGTCGRFKTYTPTNLNFAADVKVNNQSLSLSFLADQFQSGAPGLSVRLQNGVLKVNNKQVTFSGVLDDSNGNCVPGENVTMTFASGTTTLEAFLISQFDFKTCK